MRTFAPAIERESVGRETIKIIGALVQLVRIHACHAWGHGFDFFRFIKITGALVQLVRIHACHAWGHGFESRTHRKSFLIY